MKTKVNYSVILDGETYSMSSQAQAIKAAGAHQTGGMVVGDDGSRLKVAHKTPKVLHYQSSPLDDSNLT